LSLLLADVDIRKQRSVGNVFPHYPPKFTKKEMRGWEDEDDRKEFRERQRRVGIKWIGYLMSLAPLVAVGRLLHESKGQHGLLFTKYSLSLATLVS
jgi:hypothetical protein